MHVLTGSADNRTGAAHIEGVAIRWKAATAADSAPGEIAAIGPALRTVATAQVRPQDRLLDLPAVDFGQRQPQREKKTTYQR